jgi:hypothetical protein
LTALVSVALEVLLAAPLLLLGVEPLLLVLGVETEAAPEALLSEVLLAVELFMPEPL